MKKHNKTIQNNSTLYLGDCLEVMKIIPDKSIDMILCDLPYGTTACKWDVIIPFEPLWEQYNRIIKDKCAIVLFGSEPFTSIMITSNIDGYKYNWDWNKHIPSGISYARWRPMQQTEQIAIFSNTGNKINYYPQMIKRDISIKSGGTNPSETAPIRYKDKNFKKTYDYKNPITLIEFTKIRKGSLHPTQKPVALLEYLIKTYTLENEVVLDNCMGSGSTKIACINTNRKFIGIEKDEKYFNIACNRKPGDKKQIEKKNIGFNFD